MKILNKSVECVATFNEKGIPKPERIRLTDENGERQVIVIDRIHKMDKIKLKGDEYLVYTCTGIINDTEKVFELRYFKKETRWILYKI